MHPNHVCTPLLTPKIKNCTQKCLLWAIFYFKFPFWANCIAPVNCWQTPRGMRTPGGELQSQVIPQPFKWQILKRNQLQGLWGPQRGFNGWKNWFSKLGRNPIFSLSPLVNQTNLLFCVSEVFCKYFLKQKLINYLFWQVQIAK